VIVYVPPDIGARAVIPSPAGLKKMYLRGFGVPDVRVHLTAAHLMQLTAPGEGRRVLDVGCGNGWITSLMATREPQSEFVGWDRDAGSVEYARRLTAHHRVTNVRFETIDVERDALPGAFDCITCLGVLQYVHDIPALLARLNGLLKRSGVLVLQLPIAGGSRFLMAAPFLSKRLPDFREARGAFSEAEARELLGASSFSTIDTRPAIKGPSILAKECFYLGKSVGDWLAAALSPALNWVTVFDPWYPGRGKGLFVVAQKLL